jgi:hypothetical protein
VGDRKCLLALDGCGTVSGAGGGALRSGSPRLAQQAIQRTGLAGSCQNGPRSDAVGLLAFACSKQCHTLLCRACAGSTSVSLTCTPLPMW